MLIRIIMLIIRIGNNKHRRGDDTRLEANRSRNNLMSAFFTITTGRITSHENKIDARGEIINTNVNDAHTEKERDSG